MWVEIKLCIYFGCEFMTSLNLLPPQLYSEKSIEKPSITSTTHNVESSFKHILCKRKIPKISFSSLSGFLGCRWRVKKG